MANGLQEICKYFSLTEHFTIPDPVFVSKVWFDGLSKKDQDALLEAGRQFSEKWNNEVWPAATEEGLKVMKDNGVEILEVDKSLFSTKTQVIIDDFIKKASKGQKALYEALTAARD